MARVTARTVVALSWSLITGLVGGWLMLSPWSLGELASDGGWTPVARTEFFSGLGLVALSVICLAVVAVQVVAAVAKKDVPKTGSTGAAPRDGGAANSLELESTLVAVAQALTADLMSRGSAQEGEVNAMRRDRASKPADSADGRREEG
jgi:hypothetical protein